MDKEKAELLQRNIKDYDQDLKIMGEVIEKHENVRERIIKYMYQLIAAIGLVAGFGFTAVSSVHSVPSFILGEVSLFSAMATGMWFVKKAFLDEAKIYATYIDKIGKIMEERLAAKDENLEDLRSKMNILQQREHVLFDERADDTNSEIYFKAISYLFVLGGIFLLLSFFCR